MSEFKKFINDELVKEELESKEIKQMDEEIKILAESKGIEISTGLSEKTLKAIDAYISGSIKIGNE